ncbi:MAG: hypothetical protein E7557_06075 [Ruminococcaceae bacterium]|nr:hypothetical protein [Oscillospiraceae bacterium]
MTIFNCECKRDCLLFAAISSIVIGIIVAFLRITGVITITPVLLIIAFGIAVFFLLATLIATALWGQRICSSCVSATISAVLTGILGTLLLSVVLLAIPFVATSIIGAIITGALAAFLSYIFTATACTVKCFVRCGE